MAGIMAAVVVNTANWRLCALARRTVALAPLTARKARNVVATTCVLMMAGFKRRKEWKGGQTARGVLVTGVNKGRILKHPYGTDLIKKEKPRDLPSLCTYGYRRRPVRHVRSAKAKHAIIGHYQNLISPNPLRVPHRWMIKRLSIAAIITIMGCGIWVVVLISPGRIRGLLQRAARIGHRWRRIGEQQPQVRTLDDLGHQTVFNMPNLNKRRFECQNIGFMQSLG